MVAGENRSLPPAAEIHSDGSASLTSGRVGLVEPERPFFRPVSGSRRTPTSAVRFEHWILDFEAEVKKIIDLSYGLFYALAC